jgi:uncharacterized membrane protein YeaQ/YmgE (transglycosylase-associated protein family)
MIWDIIVLLIGGIIIGLLGKLVAPGDKDNIPLWLTILCGIGGILLGYWIYSFFGGDGSGGVDWVRWIVAIVVSAVLVVIASSVTGRNTVRH